MAMQVVREIGIIKNIRFVEEPLHGKWKQKGRGRRLACWKQVHGRWRSFDGKEVSIQCKYCGEVKPVKQKR